MEKMTVEDSLCRLQVHKSLDEAQIQKLNTELEEVIAIQIFNVQEDSISAPCFPIKR